MKKDKLQQILHEMYVLAFKRATPSVDYNKLRQHALDNNDNIPFEDYYLSIEDCENVYNEVSGKYKLSKSEKEALNFGFFLGHSPISKKNDN